MTADVVEQVAMVTGKLLHLGTGRRFEGSVRFELNGSPIDGRVLDDGTFAVIGRPETRVHPAAANLKLKMRVASSELTMGRLEHELTVAVGAWPVDVGTLALPVADVTKQVGRTVRGLVTKLKYPQTPISGATVEIVDAAATVIDSHMTGADGRFGFDDIVVPADSTIRCKAAGFDDQTRPLSIDFHLSMHEERFRLAETV